jgi:hypothetical protein
MADSGGWLMRESIHYAENDQICVSRDSDRHNLA